MEWQKDDFFIITDKDKLDIEYIHRVLSKDSYWAENIPYDTVEKSIAHSLCFGVFHQQKQIGFARVITDEATFGYLADVFIDPHYRGKGLSKWLIQVIVEFPTLQHLRRFLLATRDAHGLYEAFGFQPLSHPEHFMHIHRPHIYKKQSGSD